MTIPLADAQFVEIAGLRRTDVALLFGLRRVHARGRRGRVHDLLELGDAELLDFVKWSLLPTP
jgi:hypothetical protein